MHRLEKCVEKVRPKFLSDLIVATLWVSPEREWSVHVIPCHTAPFVTSHPMSHHTPFHTTLCSGEIGDGVGKVGVFQESEREQRTFTAVLLSAVRCFRLLSRLKISVTYCNASCTT